jgi:hypothetical protein
MQTLLYWAARDGIFKLLRSPEIDSARLCSLAGRYDNLILSLFLAHIDCSKIPAPPLCTRGEGVKRHKTVYISVNNYTNFKLF